MEMNQRVGDCQCDEEPRSKADSTTFEQFAMRHAAHLLFYRLTRKPSTRLNMFLMKFYLDVQAPQPLAPMPAKEAQLEMAIRDRRA
jgi:hypothetical protein